MDADIVDVFIKHVDSDEMVMMGDDGCVVDANDKYLDNLYL